MFRLINPIVLLFSLSVGCSDKSESPPAGNKTVVPSAKAPTTPRKPAASEIPQPTDEPARVVVGSCYEVPGKGQAAEAVRSKVLESITGKLREDKPELARCYKTALVRVPHLYGQMTVGVSLVSTGDLFNPVVTGFPDEEVGRCVVGRVAMLKEWPEKVTMRIRCPIAFGRAPIKSLAEQGVQLEVGGPLVLVNGKAVADASAALRKAIAKHVANKKVSPLGAFAGAVRGDAKASAQLIFEVVEAARAARVAHLGFQIQRKAAWKFIYLPELPSATAPTSPPGQRKLTVRLESGLIRIGDTVGKRWKLDDLGKERNFKMLADVLLAQKKKLPYRNDIEVSAAQGIEYGDLAATMTVVAGQGFTGIQLVAPAKTSVKF